MRKRDRSGKSITILIVAMLVARGGRADQPILDDLIVVGSACIGSDCELGEAFGYDVVRLKENNLRISFIDTSYSGSFPSNDWRITVNDTRNGGANRFSIEDLTSGSTPFTIEGGAPLNSLYLDSEERIGLGTSVPEAHLHLRRGRTPTLRLEQDGSWGFIPQTWEIGGDDESFFVRDVFYKREPLQVQVETGLVVVERSLKVGRDLTVSGSKNFAVPDPGDPDRWLYFSSLEGPEVGTYFRGTARTIAGEAVIDLPDYFDKVTEPEGLTVQLTPLGAWSRLYVAEASPARLVIREAEGADGIAFNFLVQGVRKGYADFQVQRPGPEPIR